jgi:hypothetical protein
MSQSVSDFLVVVAIMPQPRSDNSDSPDTDEWFFIE